MPSREGARFRPGREQCESTSDVKLATGNEPSRESPLIDDSRGETAPLGGGAKSVKQPFQDVYILRLVSLPTHRNPLTTYWLLSRGKTRTFKPRKDIPEGTKQYQLRKYAEATLVCRRCLARDVYPGRALDMYRGLATCD